MVQVKYTDNGYIIGKKTLWNPATIDSAYVCLLPLSGDDMEYDGSPKIISYP